MALPKKESEPKPELGNHPWDDNKRQRKIDNNRHRQGQRTDHHPDPLLLRQIEDENELCLEQARLQAALTPGFNEAMERGLNLSDIKDKDDHKGNDDRKGNDPEPGMDMAEAKRLRRARNYLNRRLSYAEQVRTGKVEVTQKGIDHEKRYLQIKAEMARDEWAATCEGQLKIERQFAKQKNYQIQQVQAQQQVLRAQMEILEAQMRNNDAKLAALRDDLKAIHNGASRASLERSQAWQWNDAITRQIDALNIGSARYATIPRHFSDRNSQNEWHKDVCKDELLFFGNEQDHSGTVEWFLEKGFGVILDSQGIFLNFNVRDIAYDTDIKASCEKCGAVMMIDATIPKGEAVIFDVKYENYNKYEARWKAKFIAGKDRELNLFMRCHHCNPPRQMRSMRQ